MTQAPEKLHCCLLLYLLLLLLPLVGVGAVAEVLPQQRSSSARLHLLVPLLLHWLRSRGFLHGQK
jgi:hypothetical protein